MLKVFYNFYNNFLLPKAKNIDDARREFILNIILSTAIFIILCGIFVHISGWLLHHFDSNKEAYINSTIPFLVLVGIACFFIFLYFLSRKGFFIISSYLLITIFLLISIYMGYRWGTDLPAEILFYTLIIVMAGILINSRFAFISTFFICSTIAVISYIHNKNIVIPNRYWTSEIWKTSDIIMVSAIFLTIATISWLSNREIERSLARARKSEAELKVERDSLEIKVEERTLQLKETQIKQISQLYRFAELGKLSSGLFHDIINPLTVASLNMEQIKNEHTAEIEGVKSYFDKATTALKRMESFIVDIRKQMANQKTDLLFSLQDEINSVIQILDYRIKKSNVEIDFIGSRDITIYGDAIKFNQIILNLLTNAIDSYVNFQNNGKQKKIKIEVYLKDGLVYLNVQDWGCGVAPEFKENIFQPFFTTKENNSGTGIGLYLIKNIVENSFGGKISFESEKDKGSIFNVNFPIHNNTDKSVNYILGEQRKDGSFFLEGNSDVLMSTAFALFCLNDTAETPVIKETKERAVNFLLQKKNKDWIFCDDIGTNFLILSALAGYNPELIDGFAMAKILKVLTSVEVDEGGPYYSDIKKQNQKIDIGTNIIIAYFLSLQDVELPNLNSLIESAIENYNFDSKLFGYIYSVIYFLSTFYKGDKKEKLINFILNKKDERNSQVDIWLAESALENLKTQKNNLVPQVIKDPEEIRIMELILKTAENKFSTLPDDAKKIALREIQKTIKGNRDGQMSLMAYYFKKALGKNGEKFSDNFIAEMGVANTFFWTAFIIYDDFWDEDEAANPQILPIANLYARHYVDFFDFVLPENTGFRSFFHKLMDSLDVANTWENIHCRAKVDGSKFFIPEKLPEYGEYEFKFRPASGHILGPVAMLVSLGYNLESAEVKSIISYFRNYLIAMQINDDAHDWEEDLKRGHISTVVDILLRDLNWQKEYIDLDKDLEELRKVFWFKTISKAEQLALSYAEKSKQALLSVKIFENLAPLEKFININKIVAEKALKEQKLSVDFLKGME